MLTDYRRRRAHARLVLRRSAYPTTTPSRGFFLAHYFQGFSDWAHTSGGNFQRGCGIGYALAIGSCEKADNVDACTTAAPDAITAFAVPNPDSSFQPGPRLYGISPTRMNSIR
jgi:hypothetical protein